MFFLPLRMSLRIGVVAGVSLVLAAGFSRSSANAQEAPAAATPGRAHIEDVLKSLSRGRSLGQVAVSPDGKRLAWIQAANGGVEIRVSPLSDMTRSQRVTAAVAADQHCHEDTSTGHPTPKRWRSFQIARGWVNRQIYTIAGLDGQPARRLSALNGYVNAPVFSPDGTQVAFLYVEGATRPAGALAAMKPPAGVIGEEGVEIQRVAMATIPPGWNKPGSPLPLSSQPWASVRTDLIPRIAYLTPANLHVYEFAWSPDSLSIAFVAADPPGENNWWVAKLYTGGTGAEGRAVKAILAPAEVAGPLHGLQIAVPRWSPDGKSIAFIGGLMSDQGVTGGDVWIVSADGGAPQDLTPHRPTSPAWIEWADNQSIFVSELAGGNSQLILLRLHGDAGCTMHAGIHGPVYSIPASVGDGRMEMSLSATSDHSLFVFQASSFDRPMELYAARTDAVMAACAGSDVGNVTQFTHLNDGVELAWGKVRFAGLEERYIPSPGLADAAQGLRSGEEVSNDRRGPRRSGRGGSVAVGP